MIISFNNNFFANLENNNFTFPHINKEGKKYTFYSSKDSKYLDPEIQLIEEVKNALINQRPVTVSFPEDLKNIQAHFQQDPQDIQSLVHDLLHLPTEIPKVFDPNILANIFNCTSPTFSEMKSLLYSILNLNTEMQRRMLEEDPVREIYYRTYLLQRIALGCLSFANEPIKKYSRKTYYIKALVKAGYLFDANQVLFRIKTEVPLLEVSDAQKKLNMRIAILYRKLGHSLEGVNYIRGQQVPPRENLKYILNLLKQSQTEKAPIEIQAQSSFFKQDAIRIVTELSQPFQQILALLNILKGCHLHHIETTFRTEVLSTILFIIKHVEPDGLSPILSTILMELARIGYVNTPFFNSFLDYAYYANKNDEDVMNRAASYGRLFAMYEVLENTTKAEETKNLFIQTANAIPEIDHRITVYVNLAQSLIKINDLENAALFTHYALKSIEELESPEEKNVFLFDCIKILFSLNDQERVTQSIEHALNNALAIQNAKKKKKAIEDILLIMAAYDSLEKAGQKATLYKDIIDTDFIYSFITREYSELGNFTQAFETLSKISNKKTREKQLFHLTFEASKISNVDKLVRLTQQLKETLKMITN